MKFSYGKLVINSNDGKKEYWSRLQRLVFPLASTLVFRSNGADGFNSTADKSIAKKLFLFYLYTIFSEYNHSPVW